MICVILFCNIVHIRLEKINNLRRRWLIDRGLDMYINRLICSDIRQPECVSTSKTCWKIIVKKLNDLILILAGEETGGMRIGYVQISDSEIKEGEIVFENSTKDTILAGLQNSPLPANSLPED